MLFDFGNDPSFDIGVAFSQGPAPSMEDSVVKAGRRFAVVDGFGGDGDKASQAAAVAFGASKAQDLKDTFWEAHRAVFEVQGLHRCMASMVAARVEDMPRSWSGRNGLGMEVRVPNKILKVAWSGNCRAYVLRSFYEDLERITQDHMSGPIITCSLGNQHYWTPELEETKFGPKDVLLLCSKGLYSVVSHQLIGDQIRCGGSAQQIASRLVGLAQNLETRENVSVLVVKSAGV